MNDWYQKELLHFAAANGNLRKVKELVETGYDINAFDDLSFTPLHYAVKSGHIEVVKYLLSVGADVNAHEEKKIGETPLGEVAANCSYEIAELLVKAGANPTIPGWMQLTSLDRARERKKVEGRRVYELLVKTAKKKFHYDAQ
jgi:ankyrin repeat protein